MIKLTREAVIRERLSEIRSLIVTPGTTEEQIDMLSEERKRLYLELYKEDVK